MGLGFGNGGDQKSGTGFGALAFLQLVKSGGFTWGVPVDICKFSSTPVGTTLVMSGIRMGRWVYTQVLVGFGASGKKGEQFDASGNVTTGYKSNTDAGIGIGVGLAIEITKRFGITAEAVVAKVNTIDSYTGGILVGPTFFPWGTGK